MKINRKGVETASTVTIVLTFLYERDDQMKKYVFMVMGMFVLLAMASTDLWARKVLVVQSYHKEMNWCEGIDQSISEVLKKNGRKRQRSGL